METCIHKHRLHPYFVHSHVRNLHSSSLPNTSCAHDDGPPHSTHRHHAHIHTPIFVPKHSLHPHHTLAYTHVIYKHFLIQTLLMTFCHTHRLKIAAFSHTPYTGVCTQLCTDKRYACQTMPSVSHTHTQACACYTVPRPVSSTPGTQGPGRDMRPHCTCPGTVLAGPGRAATLGIWATGQGWRGQWAQAEVWPCHNHFLNSWGFGRRKVTICFQCRDPEM